MGRFVNPDNSAFQAALNSRIYVDKTGMIEYMNRVLETTDAYICNSRPRRFGKSYAANMLAAYYSKGADSEMMFSDLSIGKTQDFKKYLNKYDVIHIDVQWFLANCEDKNKVVQFITKSVLDWTSCAKFIQSVWFSKTVLCLMRFQELKIKQDRNLSLLLMNGMF